MSSERRVRDTGEFELIDMLAASLPPAVRDNLDTGIGDDAAVLDVPAGESLVVTTDAMVERVHFRLDWTDWNSLGHKLLAVNLSDLAAMGARPLSAVVTLGLTGNERVVDLLELYRGLGSLAEGCGITISGGDVVHSPDALVLSLTALGAVRSSHVLRRSGAQPGDLICVSGTLGAAAAGWQLLLHPNPRATTADVLIGAHLRPVPRLELGSVLHAHGVTAAMDVSDGLAGDLPKILRKAGAAANLTANAVPVAAAVRALFPDIWFDLAIRGGEDYELLFTLPEERLPALQAQAASIGATVTPIGVVVPGAAGDVFVDGERIMPGAWDHFG